MVMHSLVRCLTARLQKRPLLFSLSALGLLLLLVAGLMPGGLELRIVPLNSSRPLLVLPLEPGELFTLQYVHSVEKAPIWEVHSVDAAGRIYIEEERYLTFGAGMGRMPGVGRLVRRGAYEVITDMHRPTGDFVLRIGSPGVDHTLVWRGTRTNLSARAPHQAVTFSARPVSFLSQLWRMVAPHEATPG